MKTATLIKRYQSVSGVGAKVYGIVWRVSPSIAWGKNRNRKSAFVIASATTVFGRPETYLFPCDKQGRVKEWIELDGSVKDLYDPVRVMTDAGYKIIGHK